MTIKDRLEYLRGQLRAECMSYDELHELQSLAARIDKDDVELLEPAGVPEHDEPKTYEVVRYRFKGENEVLVRGLTLEQAQAHCERPDTKGDGWFDGYREE